MEDKSKVQTMSLMFLGANENAPGFANQKYPAKIAVNRLYRS